MINKINVISNVKYHSNINFKSNEQDKQQELKSVESNNLDIQANYGIAHIKLAKILNMPIIKSELKESLSPDSFEGARIYSSDGKFNAIVNKDNNTTKYYYISEDEDFVEKLVVKDNKTNHIIKEENAYYDDEDEINVRVRQYSPKTGKEIAYNKIDDNELEYARKTIYLKNGEIEEISYDYEDNRYSVYGHNNRKNTQTSIHFTDDFKDLSISKTQENNNVSYTKNIKFYNGALLSTTEEKTTIAPNTLGLNPLFDNDLKPISNININALIDSIKDGEKTYYSDGSLESIKKDGIEAKYDIGGFVYKINAPDFSVSLDETGYKHITENLGDNEKRGTIISQDGEIEVYYQKDNIRKTLEMDSKYNPLSYHEYIFDDDDEIEEFKFFDYQNGVLKDVF